MTGRVIFQFRCVRKWHDMGSVTEDADGVRWLEIKRFGVRKRHEPKRVRLAGKPMSTDRFSCACGRSALIAHEQIVKAIEDGHDGMTL